jgi:hypothetical protein
MHVSMYLICNTPQNRWYNTKGLFRSIQCNESKNEWKGNSSQTSKCDGNLFGVGHLVGVAAGTRSLQCEPSNSIKNPQRTILLHVNKTHVEKNSSGSLSRVNAFRSSPSGFKRPMLMTVLDKALRLKAAGGANALLDTRHIAIRRAAAGRVATDFILNWMGKMMYNGK